MTAQETLRTLESMGTAQNRKVYARHGAGANMYGVSFANLGALRKKIKADHELSLELWASGNYDARVLATMIADPAKISAKTLDDWLKDVDNYGLAMHLAYIAARTPHAQAKLAKWTASKQEWPGATGWDLAAKLAMDDGSLPDEYFEGLLDKIESGLHSAKNRARHAMNGALIAIGVRSPALQKKALAAAGRIGEVRVDHGETGCKTPDAAAYIRKTVERKKGKG